MPTEEDAERTRDRATIRAMDTEQAERGVSTCKQALIAVEGEIAAQNQALALMIASGEHVGRLNSVRHELWTLSKRKVRNEWLVNEYNERVASILKTTNRAQKIQTKAERPISPVRGGVGSRSPEPTCVPWGFPPNFPANLKLPATKSMVKAVGEFKDWRQTRELCKQVISDMTPHLCAEVQSKTLPADLALEKMKDLLWWIVVTNCHDSERAALKNELERSHEWMHLVDELVRANENTKAQPSVVLSHHGTSASRRERSPIATEGEEAFKHSPDYCFIRYRGDTYNLTKSAGQIVCALHEAYLAGKRGVGSTEISRTVKCGKVWDQFRRRDGRRFWTALIRKTEKDFFELNLVPLADP